MIQRLSQKAFDLIVRFETGGRDFYEKEERFANWPGGSSGITIGIGYDLGYEQNLDRDWEAFLSAIYLERLSRVLGKKGGIARQALSGVRDIPVEWDAALQVFNDGDLPREIRKTLSTFPGAASRLPADAFGALVSLIFNRGTDLTGPRRIEMRAIQGLIANPDITGQQLLDRIAAQFRSMTRLWTNNPQSDGDLVDRRNAEADLIEQAS